jgi:DNA-binding NarL/FixJ family response regulator
MLTSLQSYRSTSITGNNKPQLIKLAVIDTNLLYVEGLTRLLEDIGDHSIHVFFSAWKPFKLQIEKGDLEEEVDIILIRVDEREEIMPVLSQIRQVKENIKILAHVSSMDDLLFAQLLRLGIDGVITLNSTAEELKQALFAIIEHGQYFNRDLSQIWQPVETTVTRKCHPEVTKREVEILQLIYDEFTNEEIAELLFISKRTVDGHRQNLLDKTGAKNTVGLIKFAIKQELVSSLKIR